MFPKNTSPKAKGFDIVSQGSNKLNEKSFDSNQNFTPLKKQTSLKHNATKKEILIKHGDDDSWETEKSESKHSNIISESEKIKNSKSFKKKLNKLYSSSSKSSLDDNSSYSECGEDENGNMGLVKKVKEKAKIYKDPKKTKKVKIQESLSSCCSYGSD